MITINMPDNGHSNMISQRKTDEVINSNQNPNVAMVDLRIMNPIRFPLTYNGTPWVPGACRAAPLELDVLLLLLS